jgi:hypothetical protein
MVALLESFPDFTGVKINLFSIFSPLFKVKGRVMSWVKTELSNANCLMVIALVSPLLIETVFSSACPAKVFSKDRVDGRKTSPPFFA